MKELIAVDFIHLRELRWKMSGTAENTDIKNQCSAKILNIHAQAF